MWRKAAEARIKEAGAKAKAEANVRKKAEEEARIKAEAAAAHAVAALTAPIAGQDLDQDHLLAELQLLQLEAQAAVLFSPPPSLFY
jgi:hypothetical protein